MDIRVAMDAAAPSSGSHGTVTWESRKVPCALGRAGVTAGKREGDGATPAGCFPLRRVLYRADRMRPPRTLLPTAPIAPRTVGATTRTIPATIARFAFLSTGDTSLCGATIILTT